METTSSLLIHWAFISLMSSLILSANIVLIHLTSFLSSMILLLVPPMGLEPIQPNGQGIFLLLYVTIAIVKCCSLDYFLTISYDLGCWCIVSLHLGFLHLVPPFPSQDLGELASFYIRAFTLCTLISSSIILGNSMTI